MRVQEEAEFACVAEFHSPLAGYLQVYELEDGGCEWKLSNHPNTL